MCYNREKCYKKVTHLCERFEYLKAYHILIEGIDTLEVIDISEKKRYLHQLGITLLLGKNEIDRSIPIFEEALNLGYDKKSIFVDALTVNSLGIAYYLKGEIESAKPYFDESLSALETLELIDAEDMNKTMLTLYNTAKFYSGVSNYKKAILICKTGIDIAVSENRMAHLEKLYYEKAFNHRELGNIDIAVLEFKRAYMIADIRQSEIIKQAAKEKLEEIKKGQKKGISMKLMTNNHEKNSKFPTIRSL
ncbi:hypothetical protein CKN86_00635 [Carnobacterium divergens]|uniref:hypothetical protein n=1 Tax=Carnobacterium divergens TaxID=2748 RepID=UPI000D441359|nr:hypothetical protein [Carnobacterium divergens]MCO6018590.1 hypothetical protein [Carnobacterium divergens]TFI65093.1 hypothetical protein CKN62_00635 [Carnobacterium divergens]TFI91983.1 hypothetical protein CKN84_00635 [Carnobacterium divergens]TFJ07205.1 hypothetical protein CKN86_00635 [Carnobacterium divergens]TFJ08436.1 hypothetical protein CKN65_00635 [Carnobacterium divergens]